MIQPDTHTYIRFHWSQHTKIIGRIIFVPFLSSSKNQLGILWLPNFEIVGNLYSKLQAFQILCPDTVDFQKLVQLLCIMEKNDFRTTGLQSTFASFQNI